MSVITILVPDDLAPNQNKEREYDVAFCLDHTCQKRVNIFQVWDADGNYVGGTERKLVEAHALDCYHAEMLAVARGRARGWRRSR